MECGYGVKVFCNVVIMRIIDFDTQGLNQPQETLKEPIKTGKRKGLFKTLVEWLKVFRVGH